MQGMGNLFGIGTGASMILNGMNNKKSAKYVAKHERESARIQYEVNKKEVERAFQINLDGVLSSYAGQRADLLDEAKRTASNLNIQLGERKNVDKEMDSFKGDTKKVLENEIEDNMMAMIDSQKFSMDELSTQMSSQMYQIGSNLNQTISGINKNKIRADNQANAMIASGITQIGSNAFEFYGKNWGNEMSVDTESEYQQLSDFGLNTYKAPKLGIDAFGDTYKLKSDFVDITSGKGNYLSLNKFKF